MAPQKLLLNSYLKQVFPLSPATAIETKDLETVVTGVGNILDLEAWR